VKPRQVLDMATQWKSRTSFVIATIGAAVGLGNIWRFSYVAGENGGAVFLLIYVFFVIVLGLPLVIAELALGRSSSGDAVSAFESLGIRGIWRKLGWVGVAGAVLIASYYAVIAGWSLRYFIGAVTGELWQSAAAGYGTYFDSFIASGFEPVAWQAVMLLLTAVVVAAGLKGGIERVNLVLMPLLALIVFGMAMYAITLPGSERGVAFLVSPDWSAFLRPSVYLTALGQAFFSLGLGVAVFVTYGAYLSTATPIPASAVVVAVGDTLFAIVAGVAIFGTVFSLGGDPAAGPKLAFITFPQILLDLPAGRWIGALFFFLLSAAAITSLVALVEVPAAALVNRSGWPRRKAVAFLALGIFVLGLPSALSYGQIPALHFAGMPLLDVVDQSVSNFLLPVSGLVIALVMGWQVERRLAVRSADLSSGIASAMWLWSLRVVAPVTILVILARSLNVI
jgi:neurotransmitter:Na+ symporter, NSS family